MYKEYQDAILNHYEKRKADGSLSLNLQQPSPGKVRDECIFLFRSEQTRADLSMLMSFFEVKKGDDLSLAIEQFEIDRFRPIANYLKKVTADTEYKNVELLAWLLDFPDRPLNREKKYKISNGNTEPITTGEGGEEEEGLVTGGGQPAPPIQQPIPGNPITNNSGTRKHRFALLFRRVVQNACEWLNRRRMSLRVGGVAVLGLITAIYFNNKSTPYGSVIPDKGGCMMWTGDRFQQIACDSNIGRVIKEPLDIERLQNLQRITTPDTLKREHIKKVWYRQRDRRIDFYTAGGVDPVDPTGNLRPLSVRMYEKHIEGKLLDSINKRSGFSTN